jgi:hypothetical protein
VSYYPLRIDYTGHAGQSLTPYASVQFTYENRSDDPIAYQSGVLSHPHPQRLSHIKTYVGATLVRGTTLTYAEVGPGAAIAARADCQLRRERQLSGAGAVRVAVERDGRLHREFDVRSL